MTFVIILYFYYWYFISSWNQVGIWHWKWILIVLFIKPTYAHTVYTTVQFLSSSYMFWWPPAIIWQYTHHYISNIIKYNTLTIIIHIYNLIISVHNSIFSRFIGNHTVNSKHINCIFTVRHVQTERSVYEHYSHSMRTISIPSSMDSLLVMNLLPSFVRFSTSVSRMRPK